MVDNTPTTDFQLTNEPNYRVLCFKVIKNHIFYLKFNWNSNFNQVFGI